MEKGSIVYNLILAVIFIILVIGGAWLFKSGRKDDALTDEEDVKIEDMKKEIYALMKTNFGEIKLDLFSEEAPKTVDNFVKLSKEGFYEGVKFHRVIKDFMIQSGDPNSKDDNWADDGGGGPGYAFEDEINEHKMVKGSLAMANSGPNTNGSQFFIVTADETSWLDGKHTVFGKVIVGMEIVREIEAVEVNGNDHPINDVVIESIEIIEK